ncbi:MAG TPA: TonB-dependent receptor [Telluria sp.]|nr:TonB-dependent receptor [Telluria sp.]
MRHRLAALFLLPALAHADDLVLQRVLVEGARASQLGLADAASSGTVSQKELLARGVLRPGELLEAAPGVIVSQHSGEGKANQFYLRGFNLDHGTDLRTTLEDMPVNQRSHAHGQGWTDLNFVIPELVARLDYGKGPYSAQNGDFAAAGSAALVYANRLPRATASAAGGANGYARALAAGSPQVGGGALLYAIEVLHNDGPFTHPDDYRKLNAVLRYSSGYANNGYTLTAMAYTGRWNATDQVPAQAVEAHEIGRFDAADPTDGGAARRFSLSGVWRRTQSDTADKVSAYVIRNQLDLFSNFTWFLNDPVNGDQFAQPDRRVTSGLNASRAWHTHGASVNSVLAAGIQLQNDNIFNGLLATRARAPLRTVRADHIVESSAAAFLEQHVAWSPTLRTVAGLRVDRYRFQVDGSGQDATRLSPSAGIALGPWHQTELYANAGGGFHSNDARAVLLGADGLVRARGAELGLRSEAMTGVQVAAALYRLDVASELTWLGDQGTTEAGPPSRRGGLELSLAWRAARWLAVDVDAAYARARTRAAQPARLPGAVEGVAQAGLTVDRLGPWSGALRLRYIGPRPLTEDNRVRDGASVTLNGNVTYRLGGDLRLQLEGFNLTGRRGNAASYFYASRLRPDAAARADIHFHPLEPRTLRLSLSRQY